MTALLRAEIRKLVTTRSFLALAAAVVVYPALGVTAAATAPEEPTLAPDVLLQVVRGASDVVVLGVLLLAIAAAAGEYRHGTIVPTLLSAPRRGRVVAAKVGALALAGLALAAASSAVALVGAAIYLGGRDVVGVDAGDVVVTVAAVLAVTMLYAVVGVAVGAVVRNQTAAVAGALVWVFAVENAVPIVLRDPGLKRWMPGGAADRLLHLADPMAGTGSAAAAVAMLAGLALLTAVAAVTTTRRIDVA